MTEPEDGHAPAARVPVPRAGARRRREPAEGLSAWRAIPAGQRCRPGRVAEAAARARGRAASRRV